MARPRHGRVPLPFLVRKLMGSQRNGLPARNGVQRSRVLCGTSAWTGTGLKQNQVQGTSHKPLEGTAELSFTWMSGRARPVCLAKGGVFCKDPRGRPIPQHSSGGGDACSRLEAF